MALLNRWIGYHLQQSFFCQWSCFQPPASQAHDIHGLSSKALDCYWQEDQIWYSSEHNLTEFTGHNAVAVIIWLSTSLSDYPIQDIQSRIYGLYCLPHTVQLQ
ncbi:hypothetical protein UY3_06033 [Chelonia mydas]|uniref:Uncharacterized protein n=1 Tax=Chelonia mydas TaxID=8469 RepID=M7BM11_CHEMY|nr:hypothetical protein UY3_06033 [Chelonia mydas]